MRNALFLTVRPAQNVRFQGDDLHKMLMTWICGMTFLTGLAHAADEAAPPATNFPKGTFALTLEADYAHNFNITHARLESGSVGIGYYLQDNFALGVEFAGFAVQQNGPDSIVSEGAIRLRNHLFNSGRFSLYMDVAGGVSYATARTPAAGTNFNFTIQTGPGVMWQLADHVHLMGGVRYWHLSNARLEGPLRNPSINALEAYVGVMMTF
jgi:hypothetical protein